MAGVGYKLVGTFPYANRTATMTFGAGGTSRRELLRSSAVVATGLALGACDVGSSTGNRGVGAQGNGEGQIKALFMKQAGYSEDDIQGMTKAFSQQYPKITVEPTFVAYEALHDKIVTAAAAGTFDVVLVDVVWLAEFASKRIITDVTGQFAPTWQNDLLGGALATAEYRDRRYGVPWILDTKYLFHNTEMLARAGVDTARLATWDGVLDAATALKSKGIAEYPLVWSWKQAEALVCDYTQLLGAFGGRFLSPDGTSAVFDTAGGLRALQFMKQTLDAGLSNPNSMESLEEDVRTIFSDGRAALALNWTYMFGAANDPQQSKVAGAVGIAPTPSGTPEGAGTAAPGVNGSMALAVAAGSRNQKAAWTYITTVTSPQLQERYAKSSLPCWSASYQHSAVTEAQPQVVPVAMKQLPNLVARPQVPRYHELSEILQTALQSALLGRKTPERALGDAANQANGLLS